MTIGSTNSLGNIPYYPAYVITTIKKTANLILGFRTVDIQILSSYSEIANSDPSCLLACWDCGFESRRGHGYVSVVFIVSCQSCLLHADSRPGEPYCVCVRVCVCVRARACVVECGQVQQ